MDEKIVAIICITALGITSLFLGMNGYLAVAAMTGIAGLAGYTLGKKP